MWKFQIETQKDGTLLVSCIEHPDTVTDFAEQAVATVAEACAVIQGWSGL